MIRRKTMLQRLRREPDAPALPPDPLWMIADLTPGQRRVFVESFAPRFAGEPNPTAMFFLTAWVQRGSGRYWAFLDPPPNDGFEDGRADGLWPCGMLAMTQRALRRLAIAEHDGSVERAVCQGLREWLDMLGLDAALAPSSPPEAGKTEEVTNV